MKEKNHNILVDGIERNTHVPAVYALFIRDNKIFLPGVSILGIKMENIWCLLAT